MRIIGGSAKRRALKSPSDSTGVRPILARIKKSLFDILRPYTEGADFLDLYAGSASIPTVAFDIFPHETRLLPIPSSVIG